jgi:HEPN domain-containing protein
VTAQDHARLLAAKADEDLHVLDVLCKDQATADAIWGFHAQQAVEKLLKAALTGAGVRFPFTHRLLELADLLADAQDSLDEKFEPLLDLTPYAVQFRYPNLAPAAKEPPLERDSILKLINELRHVVRSRL